MTETPACYVIGDFEIEPDVRRLRRLDGEAIAFVEQCWAAPVRRARSRRAGARV